MTMIASPALISRLDFATFDLTELTGSVAEDPEVSSTLQSSVMEFVTGNA